MAEKKDIKHLKLHQTQLVYNYEFVRTNVIWKPSECLSFRLIHNLINATPNEVHLAQHHVILKSVAHKVNSRN